MNSQDGGPPTPGLADSSLDDLLRAAWTEEPPRVDPRCNQTVLDPERYRDFRLIGTGGMGVVFLALDTELNRPVAVKVVRPPAGRDDGETESPTPFEISPPAAESDTAVAYSELSNRFLQEAWLTGVLEHPGIVPVYELGRTPRGVPYYTMRYVRGVRTLETALDEATSAKDRLDLLGPFLHVCDAIRYAHSRGVIHRDLKPANIGIGEFGEVFVLDWGLAKMRGEPDAEDSVRQDRIREFRDSRDMHTVAKALGTPGYMFAEAALGDLHRVDERSDVYSLGAILYRILTGKLPFEFESYPDLLHQMREKAPAAASAVEPSVSVDLAEICTRALSFAPEDRHAGAGQLADAVREQRRETRIRAEIRGLIQEAGTAFEAAEEMDGDGRLRQVDRVRTLCHRVLELREGHARARRLLADSDRLRKRTDAEREQTVKAEAEEARLESVQRERDRHRRRLRRAAVAVLFLFAIGTAAAAWVFDGKRREAEAAEREKADLLADLGITEQDRDEAKEQIEALLEARGRERTDLAQKDAEITSLEERLAEAADRLSGALADRDKLNGRLEKLDAAMGESDSDLTAQETLNRDLRTRVDTLQRDLESEQAARLAEKQQAEQRAQEYAAALAAKDTRISDLAAKLAKTEEKLAALERAADVPEPISKERERMMALAMRPGASALRALIQYTHRRSEPDPERRHLAIEGLGLRGAWDEAALDFLLDLLDRSKGDLDLQARVLTALGATGDARAAAEIVKVLRRYEVPPREIARTGCDSLARIRAPESVEYLLYIVNLVFVRKATGFPSGAIERLKEITGLPFESAEAWNEWGLHLGRNWLPTPLDLPAEGLEFRSDSWRIRLRRPDEERWDFTRPEGTVVRIGVRDAPGPADAAWVEIRACSAIETFPKAEDEKTVQYEKRRFREAVDLARRLLPDRLREAEDALVEATAVLGGERAVKISGESLESGTWRVYVVERNELLYTVIRHHGPAVPKQTQENLDEILESFRFLDEG